MRIPIAAFFLFLHIFLFANRDTTNISPRLVFYFDGGMSGNAGHRIEPLPQQFYSTGYGTQETFHGITERKGTGYSFGTSFFPVRTKRIAVGFGIAYSLLNYREEILSVETEYRLLNGSTFALERFRHYAYYEKLVQFPIQFRANFAFTNSGVFHFDGGVKLSLLDRFVFPNYSVDETPVGESYREKPSIFYSAGIFYDYKEMDFYFPSTMTVGLTTQILSDTTVRNRKPFFFGMQIGFNICRFRKQ